LVHLIGFTMEIYYDARPYERQISSEILACSVTSLNTDRPHSLASDRALEMVLSH